jgi:hypothetical protein
MNLMPKAKWRARLVVYLENTKEVLSCIAKAMQAAEAEEKAAQASQAASD